MPGRTSARTRRAARLAGVQALYQIELTGAAVDTVVCQFNEESLAGDDSEGAAAEFDRLFFGDLVRGVLAHRSELDELVSDALTADWPLERLDAVLRAILRAGAWELLARSDVPARVAINEYLEVARDFFDGRESSLVNGVLDRLAHVLRPRELEPRKGDEKESGSG